MSNDNENKSDAKQNGELSDSVTKPLAANKNMTGKLSLLISMLVIVALVVALVVAAYFLWPLWQTEHANIEKNQQQLIQQKTELTKTISQQSERINQQQQQINTLLKTQEKDSELQQIIQQRLDAQATQLNTLSGASRDGWIVEEVRYLLRLANQRRLMGGDVAGVVGLLESADALIRELDAPDLFPVREKINNNIMALKISPSVDREGLYVQLSALQQQIELLPDAPLKLKIDKREEVSVAPLENNLSWWQVMVKKVTGIFSELDSYVRVTHHQQSEEVALSPVLSDMQQSLLRQRLQLLFEQAKIALLKEDKVIYQHSLDSVIVLLTAHFQHFPEKKSLVEQTQLLKNQRVNMILPDISSSLETLDNYLLTKRTPVVPPIDKPAEETAI